MYQVSMEGDTQARGRLATSSGSASNLASGGEYYPGIHAPGDGNKFQFHTNFLQNLARFKKMA